MTYGILQSVLNFQAQILIPMATSLAFGLMLATFLVLVLVPVFYRIYHRAFPFHEPGEEDYDEPSEDEQPATVPLRKVGDERLEFSV